MAFRQNNTPSIDISGLSREDAITEIAAEISRLEAQICSLRSLHNSFAPISKLPDQVLSKIFVLYECARADSGEGTESSGTRINRRVLEVRLILSWVSRHWREVALKQPLWRTIVMEARSNLRRDLLLPDLGLIPTIILAPSRIEVFNLSFESNTSPRQILVALKHLCELEPASLPPTLDVTWASHSDENISLCFFPYLQSLILHSCTLYWGSIYPVAPDLTRLELYDFAQKIALFDFLPLLASLPRLTTCVTRNALGSLVELAPHPQGRFSAYQLAAFNITEPMVQIGALLGSLNAPNASITITRSTNEEFSVTTRAFVESMCRALKASQNHIWNDIDSIIDKDCSLSICNSESRLRSTDTIRIPEEPNFVFALSLCLERCDLRNLRSIVTSSPLRLVWDHLSSLKKLERIRIESKPSLVAFIEFLHSRINDPTVAYTSLFPALQELVLQDSYNEPEWLDKLYEILASRSIRRMLKKLVFLEAKPNMFYIGRLEKVVDEIKFGTADLYQWPWLEPDTRFALGP
ncbi:hypothetical protein BDN72DRAFT_847561 [Pluteus cervinus]|uniref:Uncharacterized protein n=1 Tax=Pluteus cervinus TaxID=181527 RepID=A0ACD3AC97_9AGAR|nr:hypothetical protein BDN72DRAFT_847561 [Pluteus cervinus]